MEHSESIKTFAGAFVKAQAKIEGAAKASVNPHFKSRYADLASVMEACKVALNENGISVIQAPAKSDTNRLLLETILIHDSGEWIKGVCDVPLPKQDPQGFGSALTYARRYGLASMVGVCPEDDDGNGASEQTNGRQTNGHAQPTRPASKPSERRIVPPEQSDSNGSDPGEQERLAIQIGELLSAVEMPKDWAAKCLAKAGVKSWYEVPVASLTKCIAAVNAKQAKGKEVANASAQ